MRASTQILVIDPLTLLGRELARLLSGSMRMSSEVSYLHTIEDDEYQIAELEGEPALVPRLEDRTQLDGCRGIIVASEVDTLQLGLVDDYLDDSPDTLLLDLSRLDRFLGRTVPVAGPGALDPSARQLRLAHPALVAAVIVAEPLRHLAPVALNIAIVDPASTFGRVGVEILARQAARRLQGAPVDELLGDAIRAFTSVAVDASRLTEEAAVLMPDLPTSVTLTLSGCFHGHVSHLAFTFDEPVDEFELLEALHGAPRVRIGGSPLSLDSVPDSDQVLIALPQLSPSRTSVGVTAMVDGLRIGGAVTALEILEGLF